MFSVWASFRRRRMEQLLRLRENWHLTPIMQQANLGLLKWPHLRVKGESWGDASSRSLQYTMNLSSFWQKKLPRLLFTYLSTLKRRGRLIIVTSYPTPPFRIDGSIRTIAKVVWSMSSYINTNQSKWLLYVVLQCKIVIAMNSYHKSSLIACMQP